MVNVTLKPFRRSLPVTSAPCARLGGEVKLGTQRTYRECTAGFGSTKGDQRQGLVSTCGGCGVPAGVWRLGVECGPKCGGYQAGGVKSLPTLAKRGKAGPTSWVPVPPPVHMPTSDRLLLTIATGPAGKEIHAVTGPGQRAYAERIGAEYVDLTDATQSHSCFEKFRVGEWVKLYPGGTLYLDADILVSPDAPDVFAHCPPDQIGMVDVLPRTPHLKAWAPTHLKPLCESQGVPYRPEFDARYWNSGVWVGRPDHASYWTPPERPTPGGWCDEEGWCRRNVHAHGLPVHDLDPRFNWTWMEDREFKTWERARPWFVHLCGMGNHQVSASTQLPLIKWRAGIARLIAAVWGTSGPAG